MQRILLSLGMLVFVGAVIVGATGAFFSDTETSTGNTFTAGDIDLQIDNESYIHDYNIPGFGSPTGAFVLSTTTSWELANLTIEKFFNFTDLKPGDIGEDTISIHVGSNSAWVCAAAQVTTDDDVSCTEPESDDDPSCTEPDSNLTDGDLDDQVNFAFWVDDGDNVFESVAGQSGTPETIFLGPGPISAIGAQGQIAIADSGDSVLPDDGPVPGNSTFYIGKAWCFGNMASTNLVQDGAGDLITPLSPGGTGFNCDGSQTNNAAQTDQVVGDLEFFAVQSRNNTTFTCNEDYTPSWEE